MRKSQMLGASTLLMLAFRLLVTLTHPATAATADLPRPHPAIFQATRPAIVQPHEIPMIGPNGQIIVTLP